MIEKTRYIAISIFIVAGSAFSVLNAQNFIGSLNDSIIKYKLGEPKKALDFGFLALESFKDEEEITLEYVNTNYYLGEVYYFLREYKTSFEYLSKSLELYDLLKPNKRRNKNVIKPPWVLNSMGIVYYQKEDYVNAEKFYNEALYNFQLFDSNYDIEKYYGINTSLLNLSLIKRDQGDLKSSEELLNQLFERVNSNAISKTDVLQVYISYMELFLISGNDDLFVNYYNKIKTAYEKNSSLDDILFKESQVAYAQANLVYANFLQSKSRLEESLEYLFLAKELFISIPQRILNVNLEISNTFYSMGMNNKAKELIQQNLSDEIINQSQKLDNFKLLEKIYSDEGSTYNLLSVKDSIIFYNEDPLIKQEENEFNTLENLILVSEKQNDLRLSKVRTNRIILVSFLSSSILLLILLSLKFNNDLQKEKNRRLNLEKDKINEELKLKRRELFSKVNFISQRNDYLNKLRDQLGDDISNPLNLKNIKREIKNITTSEKAYEEFDKMFSKVYPKFYKRLNAIAKLSQTDIRLASYIKMNHSNNEISRISGISPRTVESQRYRLSKKLNIAKGQDLNRFIFDI
ncbi:MAG: LuxR C-terminal-related transcriptional regulator [Flavobacteriaceae bacterium]|nr:LuxR C-terminal-related transcriptional regulator [Flavobacteriaceae bacterium]